MREREREREKVNYDNKVVITCTVFPRIVPARRIVSALK